MAFAYQCDECGKQSIGETTIIQVVIERDDSPRDRILHFCKYGDCYSDWFQRSLAKREQDGKTVWIGDKN